MRIHLVDRPPKSQHLGTTIWWLLLSRWLKFKSKPSKLLSKWKSIKKTTKREKYRKRSRKKSERSRMQSPRRRLRRLPRRPMIRKWTNLSSCNCRSKKRSVSSTIVRFLAPRHLPQTLSRLSLMWRAASNPSLVIPKSQMVMMMRNPPVMRTAVNKRKVSRMPMRPSSISVKLLPREPLKAKWKSMRKKRKKMPRKSDKKTPLKLPKRRRSVRKKSRNRRKSRLSEMRSRRKKMHAKKDCWASCRVCKATMIVEQIIIYLRDYFL